MANREALGESAEGGGVEEGIAAVSKTGSAEEQTLETLDTAH